MDACYYCSSGDSELVEASEECTSCGVMLCSDCVWMNTRDEAVCEHCLENTDD